MAFMLPVVKNDYNIYTKRKRTTSSSSTGTTTGRRHTQSESVPASLSCSPESDVDERLAALSLGASPRRMSEMSPPKSSSMSSLNRFHKKVVQKLRRKSRQKEDAVDSTT